MAKKTPETWEYRVDRVIISEREDLVEQDMNALGLLGWELVAIRTHGSVAVVYIYKRKL